MYKMNMREPDEGASIGFKSSAAPRVARWLWIDGGAQRKHGLTSLLRTSAFSPRLLPNNLKSVLNLFYSQVIFD